MIMQLAILTVLATMGGLLASQSSAQSLLAAAEKNADLGGEVLRIFERECSSCHKKEGKRSKDFNILDIESLRAAPEERFLSLTPPTSEDPSSRSERSNLYYRMIDEFSPMPPSGMLDQEELEKVRAWVDAGAPSPLPVDPTLPRLEDTAEFKTVMNQLRADYDASIGAAVDRACGDCHSPFHEVPSQAYWPLVGHVVSNHIVDGNEAFSVGFPFGAVSSIDQVRGNIKSFHNSLFVEQDMPPWDYYIAHYLSGLSGAELEAIDSWIVRAEDALSELALQF